MLTPLLLTLLPPLVVVQLETPAPCRFSIIAPSPTEIPADGPPEIRSRLKLLPQAGLPVVVTAADFTEAVLKANGGNYDFSGRISIEVMNVSDSIVSSVKVGEAVLRTPSATGTSGHHLLRGDLGPGERRTATFKVASRGSDPRESEVEVVVGIGTVVINGCRLEPSPSLRSLFRQRR